MVSTGLSTPKFKTSKCILSVNNYITQPKMHHRGHNNYRLELMWHIKIGSYMIMIINVMNFFIKYFTYTTKTIGNV